MTVRISAAHRDAIYEQIVDRLTGIGDVWLAVERGDFATATRLSREFSDYMCFVLEDLGWGDGAGRTITLSTPADVLRRVFSGLRELAEGEREEQVPTREEIRKTDERINLVLEACQEAFTALDVDASTTA